MKRTISDSPRVAKFLILVAVMVILPSGWEKEDAMNAIACCEGEEMTYCEEVCFFATGDEAEPVDPQPFWQTYEGFGGP